MMREKDITIYDLAKSLKLSIATVSRALKDDPVVNKKTKKRIIELAESLGYRTNHFAKPKDTKNKYDRSHYPPSQQLFYVYSHSRDGIYSQSGRI